jgi:dTDP-glucose 4,6-dehydratase
MKMDDGRVIPNFIVQALKNDPITIHGDGSQTRSFCYVGDFVEGIIRMMNSSHTGPVNIGNSSEIRIVDLARLILEIVRSKSEIIFHPLPKEDPKVRRPDIEKAERLLGWKPKIDLREGLNKTVEWFKAEYMKD